MGRKRSVTSESLPFDSLPEDCISNIISFTNPRDACVAATVSKTFESAVKSDIIWEKFLPAEYESLIPPSRSFSSKKELYFSLCNDPVLSTMTKRFEKVAKLVDVCWFEIRGRTNARVLSPRTRYSAYIVFKKVECYGFQNVPIEAAVGVVGQEPSRRFICFDEAIRRDGGRRNLVKPKEREDGWMEIELGEFFIGGGIVNSDEIEMSALETKQLNWKCGLIIQGIEIRLAKIL